MENIMTLREAIKENHIKIGTECIKYQPDNRSITVLREETGTQNEQEFTTTPVSWKLIEAKEGQLALIAVTSTGQYLTLYGKVGATNSKKVLDAICNLWGSERLNLVAQSIIKKEYNALSVSIKSTLKGIWLGSHEDYLIKENGLVKGDLQYFVFQAYQETHCRKFTLFSEKFGGKSRDGEIRPIIYLPDEILIDVSTNILYRDYKDVSKMKLGKMIKQFEKNRKVTDKNLLELKEILSNM